MRVNKGFIIIVFSILLIAGICFAQGQPQQKSAPAESEQEMQWLWGEVVNLDPQNKMILVKYLDYETEQEKEAAIEVDGKTAYESIKSIEELKQNDPVSIDYIITPDGKNIARVISLEKSEEETAVPEKAVEAVENLSIPESDEESPEQ